ncbi:hypothetical protein BBC27_08015 [Acidithiobacillus ferrivorans]|uniref:Uncharacterized protein n=1 Tax=Acidithiobacillus ferrivorans TaxID=160808 RepID=A0A1B9C0B5_9PROT|nr:hypothetical protein [Acidithiobacillus ferrivorans]OCB03402.1 hypothetical protein BBC27_08015 [Acidithiobacillus ferrivorans]
MEYSDSFDDSWIHKTNLRKDLIEEFISAFSSLTDGLELANADDLDRAISAARAIAIEQIRQEEQDDGQS